MIETRDRTLLEQVLRREEAWAGYALPTALGTKIVRIPTMVD